MAITSIAKSGYGNARPGVGNPSSVLEKLYVFIYSLGSASIPERDTVKTKQKNIPAFHRFPHKHGRTKILYFISVLVDGDAEAQMSIALLSTTVEGG